MESEFACQSIQLKNPDDFKSRSKRGILEIE